jgi:hypothetical protein
MTYGEALNMARIALARTNRFPHEQKMEALRLLTERREMELRKNRDYSKRQRANKKLVNAINPVLEAKAERHAALAGQANTKDTVLREAMRTHQFAYDQYHVVCACGWVSSDITGYTNAWEQWIEHTLAAQAHTKAGGTA